MVRNRFPRPRTVEPFPESFLPQTYHRAYGATPEEPAAELDVPYVVTLLQALHHLEKVRRKEGTSKSTSPGS